jgi:prolyl-tRNA editing enzyme YbaK/EbsC (Cys-tRNA(Pro) deacylase)
MSDTEDQAVLPEGQQRVSAALLALGHPHAPVMLDEAARTAQQAADGLGVALGQIAKSIIFRLKRKPDSSAAGPPQSARAPSGGSEDTTVPSVGAMDLAVLVITSGDRRVDEARVQALVCTAGSRLGRADAAFVKAKTGFSIGGVAPLAHAQPLVTLIDRELFRFDEIWAAAGHPHAVFKLRPQDLERLTGASVADVVELAA